MIENGREWKSEGILRWRDDRRIDQDGPGGKYDTKRWDGCHQSAATNHDEAQR